MPTIALCTGFEHGISDATALVKGNAGVKYADALGGSPTLVSTGAVKSGTYCLELNPAAATEYLTWSTNTLGASKTALVASVWIRFPGSLPANDCTLIYLVSSTAEDQVLLFRNSDDKIGWQDHAAAGAVTAGPTVVADTWYLVEFRYDVSAATHTVDWRVDGAAQTQHSRAGVGAGTVSELALGHRFNSQTMTCRYDDLVASVTSGDYPLGGHKVVQLIPDAGGSTAEIGTANATARFTSNGTVDTTHNSANILAALSEVPPTIGATASGIAQRTAGSGNAAGIPMTTYILGAGESISGVRVTVIGWAGSATANNLNIRTFNGTTETTIFATADPNFDNSTTSPGFICEMAAAADFDTQSELDALVVRLGYATDVSPTPGAHAIYAEVAVLLASGPAAVGKDLALVWDDRAALGDTLQTVWDVRAAVGDPLQTIWDLRSAVADTLALVWNVRAVLGDTLQLIWNVQTLSTAVGKDLGLLWNTRAALGDPLQAIWNTRAAIGDPVALVWNTRAAIGDPLDLRWNTRAAVADTLALIWNVQVIGLTAIGKDLALVWNLKAPASKNLQAIWDTRAPLADTLDLRWGIRTPISKTSQLVWHVRTVAGDDLVLVWDVDSQAYIPIIAPVAAVRRNAASAAARTNPAAAVVGGNPAASTPLQNPAEGSAL